MTTMAEPTVATPPSSTQRGLYHARAEVIDATERVVQATVNTVDVDRLNTIIKPSGGDFTHYLNNPVVMYDHKSPLGQCLELERTDQAIRAKWQFFDASQIDRRGPMLDLIEDVWHLYSGGVLRAHSLRFNPLARPKLRDGVFVYDDWELIEFSLLPIPGNPNALSRSADTLHRYLRSAPRDSVQVYLGSLPREARQRIERLVDETWDDLGMEMPSEMPVGTGPVQFEDTPTDDSNEWDGDAAEQRLREWASSDGSGDKETIDWPKYRRGFAWYDENDPEDFEAYKLPHHDIIDGEFRVVRGGVIAASNALEGSRGGVDIPDEDRPGVRSHLNREREKFDGLDPLPIDDDEDEGDSDEASNRLDSDSDMTNISVPNGTNTSVQDGVADRSFRDSGRKRHLKTSGQPSALSGLAARVFDQPLVIHPRKLDTILTVLSEHLDIEAPLAQDEIEMDTPDREKERSFPMVHGVAVLPVHGTLVQRSFGLEALSGLTSYQKVERQFAEALEDDEVQAIAFDIDSPGGEAAGLFDFVDRIFNARGQKPIWAVVNEAAFSGAYAIASAADRIVLPRTGGVGSVGVVTLHVDQSEADEEAGLDYTYIFFGDHKTDANPHEPLDDDAEALIQERVNDIGELFVETVARNRGMEFDAVRDTEARTYFGQNAVDIGFADEVMSAREAMSALSDAASSEDFAESGDDTASVDDAVEAVLNDIWRFNDA